MDRKNEMGATPQLWDRRKLGMWCATKAFNRDSSKGTNICITHRNLYGQLDGQVYGQTDWCQEGAIPLLIVESTQARRARLSVHNIQPAWLASPYSLQNRFQDCFCKQVVRCRILILFFVIIS